MDTEWKKEETQRWISSVCSPALSVVFCGLAFKTLHLYVNEVLPGWQIGFYIAFICVMYASRKFVHRVSSENHKALICNLIVEAMQCYCCLLSLFMERHQCAFLVIVSSVLCLTYQVKLFSSSVEIILVISKHFLSWFAVSLYFSDTFFPIGALTLTIVVALQSNAHKKQVSKDLFKSHHALSAQEEMMRSLIQAVPDGVMVFTEKGEVPLWNTELCEILCVTTAEKIPAVIAPLIYEPEMKWYTSSAQRLLDDLMGFLKSTLQGQTFGTTKLKEEYLEWRGNRCMFHGLRACILIVRNNTKWIRMHEKMKMESAYKSSLIRSVSHELRTPTNAIINLSQQVSSRTDVPENCREDMELVRVCSHFLLSMINDLLDFSKVLAGKFTLVRSQFDLGDELKHVYRLFVPQCKVKGLDLKLNIDPTLPKLVYSDPTRFKQVLLNLLSNAVK